MTAIEQQIGALLARRQEIIQTPEGGFTANNRWLLEAVDLLLRHQLELERLQAQKHDLLLTMAEAIQRIERMQAELRNNGILR